MCRLANCERQRVPEAEYCFDHLVSADRYNFYRDDPKYACIYFIGVTGDDTAVKIGRTGADIKKRLGALQIAHYRELVVLATIVMLSDVEKHLHQLLADDCIRGEWFRRSDRVNEIIASAASGNNQQFIELIKAS